MEEREPGGPECRICGSDICCDLAHAAFQPPMVFVCHSCGMSVTVNGAVSSAPSCCGREMSPDASGIW